MTSTLVRPGTFYVSSYQPRRFAKRDNGNMVFEGVPVFRSGTFRDSMGEQNTWTEIHLRQMIDNYNYLANNNIFKDIPVRDGHPGWLIHGLPGNGKTVGWHTGVSVAKMSSPVDGQEYDYLLADYEIIDPEAVDAVERGLWRNRSAEMIRYLTNDEAEYWPVYGGFAFVDIPAVEGLNFSAPQGTRVVMLDEETRVSQPLQGSPAAGAAAQLLHTARPGMQTGGGSPETQPHVFSVNGQPVTDYAAVQQHIATLEQFRNETRQSSRHGFIDALAHRNVILATAVQDYKNLADTMTDEQWSLWQKGYAHVEASPILSVHAAPAAGTATHGTQTPGGGTGADQAIEVAKGIVAMHRSMNTMSEAQLKKTDSYRKLVAAGIEQA